MLQAILTGLGIASPWLMRGAPHIARGGKALWNLGKGLNTAAGRRRAGQAIYGRGTPSGPPRFDPSGMPIPGTPGVPPGLVNRAGTAIAGRPNWQKSLGGGALGLGAGYLLESDPEEQVPGVTGMPAQIPGYGPSAAPGFTSNLPSYAERAKANRAELMENMSTIIKHSMLLQFQNPGRKNSYMKDAIGLMKMTAEADNDVEVALMIDEVFKDKKVPKTAKTIYKRMIAAGASPKEASEVSGYTLDIEETEAKAAADYARARDPSKLMSKKEMKWQSILRQAQTDLDGAATTLAQAWGAGTDLKLQDYYAGYETRDFQELKDLALELLGGGTRGATQAGGSGILTIDKS